MVAIVAGGGLGLGQASSRTLGGQGVWGAASGGYLGSNYLVNASTGNLVIQQQDDILTGVGPDIAMSRTYNSLGLANDDNGDNWRQSSQRVVNSLTGTVNTAGSTIKRTDWDGSEQVFTYDSAKAAYIFKDTTGAFDKLMFNSGTNQWTWTDGDSRIVEIYDNANGGRIISSTDLDGKALTFTYTGANLTRITDANGEYTSLSWTNGNLTQLANYKSDNTLIGTRVRYAYDSSNRLTTVTIDLSPEDSSVADGKVVTYTYTYDGTSKRVASISETGSGSLVAFTYDATSKKITSVTETAAAGDVRTTSFDYSLAGRTRVTDALGNLVDYFTDGTGRITSVVSGSSSQTVQYSWDATTGRIASVTDPMGKVTSYAYDASGNNIRVTDAAGNVVERTFDPVTNAMLTETRYILPDPDGAGTATASSPVTTRYAYDSKNHLRYVVSPEGRVTEYRYNSLGQNISKLEYTGNSYTVSGLSANAAISEASLATWSTGLDAKTGVKVTDIAYDFRGNISSVTKYGDLNSNRIVNSNFEKGTVGWGVNYDPSAISVAGSVQTGLNGSFNFIRASFTATAANQIVCLGSKSGYLTPVKAGERLSLQAGVEATGAIGMVRIKVSFYNSAGAAIGSGFITDPLNGQLAFNTRISAIVPAVPADAVQACVELVVNSSGAGTGTYSLIQPMLSAVAAGQVAVPEFNTGPASAAPIGVILAGSTSRETYVYDQAGLLLSRQEAGRTGAEVYTYDGLGRLLSSTDFAGNTTQIAFTDANRRTVITLANGQTKTSDVNQLGEVVNIVRSDPGITTETAKNYYDKLGRLKASVDALGNRTTLFYDTVGRKIGEVDRNGMLVEYRYDADNRLIATIRYASRISASALTSLVDGNGNPTAVTLAAILPAADANNDRWAWYSYDNADRLVQKIETIDGSWQAPFGKVTTYAYDGVGQLLETREFSKRLSQVVVAGFKNAPPGALNKIYGAQMDTTEGFQLWQSQSGLLQNNIANGYDSASGLNYVQGTFRAKAVSDMVAIIPADGVLMNITGGERLAVSAGIGGTQGVNALTLTIKFYDANNNLVGESNVASTIGQKNFNTSVGGFVNAPATAVRARLLLFATASSLNTDITISLTRPMVSSASPTQTLLPSFSAVPLSDARDRLTRNFYSSDGLLQAALDADGAFRQFGYDAAGRLVRTVSYAKLVDASLRAGGSFDALLANVGTSSSDRTDYIVYDGQSRVRYRLDANLRPTEYVYNVAGDIIRTIEYGASIGSASSYTAGYVDGQVATLALQSNAATRVTRAVYDGAGRLVYVIDAEGFVTANSYDNVGHVTKTVRYTGGKYASTGDPSLDAVASWISANANAADRATRSFYDALDRLVYSVDGAGFVREYRYDLNDRLIKDIRYAAPYTITDSATVASVKAQLPAVIPADVVTRSYAYDANGNLVDSWDGEGVRTHYDYTAFGQAWQTIRAYATADAASTQFQYDTAGRLIKTSVLLDASTSISHSYVYDGLGNLTSETDGKGYTTSYTYDALGQRLSQTVPLNEQGASATTSYVYDGFGNVVKTTDPRGYASYSYYDKLDRLTLTIDQEGYATATSYTIGDEVATVTRYAKRVSGTAVIGTPPAVTTDAADATTSFTRDKLGRVTKTTDAEGYYEQYTLNAFGDRTSVRNKLGGVTNNLFDERGLLLKETLPVDGIANTFSYDERGNLKTKVEAFGRPEARTTSYAYDRNDRLKSKTGDEITILDPATMATSKKTPVERYTYDLRGNLILTEDAGGARTWLYYDAANRKVASISPVGTLSTWDYDANGNVTKSRVYASGVTLPTNPGGSRPSSIVGDTFRETTYSYDRNNRLAKTSIIGVLHGTYNAGYDSSAIATGNEYDAAGNVIRMTDANGGKIYSYYDKLGRRTGQIDQMGYVTSWTLDNDGNALSETRFATRFTGTPSLGGTPPSVATNAKDRTTSFTYDKNGRRLSEARLNVEAYTVDANGSLQNASGTAKISYSYNELGQVLSKTEANGDATQYRYDAIGRQISVTGPSLATYSGANSNQQLIYYDGLNNVTRTAENGTQIVGNGTRTTLFSYEAGSGRLVSSTDPMGNITKYYYDAAGRVTATEISRQKSNAQIAPEQNAQSLRYDAAGRQTTQMTFVQENGAWVARGDRTDYFYNSYGEVIRRGTNIGGIMANAQEYANYDGAGRVWRTNFNDGVGKAYLYDGNGNATLLFQSKGGVDLSNYASITEFFNVAGISQAYSVFDARNQLIDTIQVSSNNEGMGRVTATPVPGSDATPKYFRSESEFNRVETFQEYIYSYSETMSIYSENSSVINIKRSPSSAHPPYNSSRITDIIVPKNLAPSSNSLKLFSGSNILSISVSENENSFRIIIINGSSTLSLATEDLAGGGLKYLFKDTYVPNQGTVAVTVAPSMEVRTFSSAGSVRMMVRPMGSTGAYDIISAIPVMDTGGNALPGRFSYNLLTYPFYNQTSSLWEIIYEALDAVGGIVDAKQGTLTLDSAGNPTSSFSPYPVNGPGQAFSVKKGSSYVPLFTGLPTDTRSLRVSYRVAGTNGAFSQVWATNGEQGQTNWWTAGIPADGQTYEYWLEPLNASGNMIGSRSKGTYVGNGAVSSLVQYADTSRKIILSTPSGQNVTRQRVQYFANGIWTTLENFPVGEQLDLFSAAPDFFGNYSIPVIYETYDGATMLSRLSFTANLGYNGNSITDRQVTPSPPPKVSFTPAQTGGTYLRLYWRETTSSGDYQARTIAKAGNGYAWDLQGDNLVGTHNIEYYYEVLDSAGQVLPNLVGSDYVRGYIQITDGAYYTNSTSSEIRWTIDTAVIPNFQIHRKQDHNAFGEVISETDGRGNVTTFDYNSMGKLTSKVGPEVDVTDDKGVITKARPTDRYYYDLSGRLVGQDDANGNRTTQTLLAGTGHGGTKALATVEFRPGTTMRYGYDVFGNLRESMDGNFNVTENIYDLNSNLVEVRHAMRSDGVQLIDYYDYDALGQRIRHSNSQLGSATETTDYDVMGRVVSTKSFAGQTVNYSYNWVAAATNLLATNGLGNFGGWQTITTLSAGKTQYENKDLFGHLTWRQDYGNHSYAYSYDLAGRLIQQVNSQGQNIGYAYYDNGYVKSVTDNALQMRSNFAYDKDGNRTQESYTGIETNTVYYQNAVISYDALNRITQFLDAKATITYKYDAVGNRRNVHSIYHDGVNGSRSEQDFWYKYDGQNRFVLTMGKLPNGSIVKGADGVEINYDGAGNRVRAIYADHEERYSYTADGYLEKTEFVGGSQNGNVALRTNDRMGRVTNYVERASTNGPITYSRASTYDGDSRLLTEDVMDSTGTSNRSYVYRAWNGSAYEGADQGVVTKIQSVTGGVTINTTYDYIWWDEAKTAGIHQQGSNPSNPNNGAWAAGNTDIRYDVNGHISQMVDQTANGGPRTVTFRNDAYGQVLVREERQAGSLGPRQLHYYFNGMRIGDVGNDGKAESLVDYAQQMAAQSASRQTGMFRQGRPVSSADFDQNYQPINRGYPASAPSSYTVRSGDTLRSIAQALWGDGALWYMIAEINGLSASSQLVAGQRIAIPNKVTNFHNNSGTFRVYNPGEAIGDLLPTLPNEPAPPPARKGGGCGGFGAILVAVIAVAVTAIVAPQIIPAITQALAGSTAAVAGATVVAGTTVAVGSAAAIAGGVIGGALAAAAGSIVSQGLGLATGLQDKINWSSIGLAAIAGGVAGGLAGAGAFSGAGKIISSALRGAAGNGISQGLGLATGLQARFDWANVATAGVGASVGSSVGLSGTGGRIVSGVAGGIAASAAESLVSGNSFGDTLMANLPSIIANTVGNLVADAVSKPKLGYAGVGSDDGLAGGGGGTSGAGDGARAQPTTGVGGGKIRSGASGNDAQAGDVIEVIADPHQRDMFRAMNQDQYRFYANLAGEVKYNELAALKALAYSGPTPAWSMGSAGQYNISLANSFQQRMPWENFSYGGRDYTSAAAAQAAGMTVITNGPSAASVYRAQRDQAFVSSIGQGAFGLGPIAYAMGGSPETIGLSNQFDTAIGGLAVGGALRSGGRVNLPVGRAAITSPIGRGDSLYWPPNDGVIGISRLQMLPVGYRIDRYGYDSGRFVAPMGTPVPMRSLEPGTTSRPYNVYEVTRPVTVESGGVAPWFGQPGGGAQHKLPTSVTDALGPNGYLRRVGP